MTLGEIKIESLRLMHVNEDQIIDEENLASLIGSEQYGIFLVNMVGAINRCFLDLENKGVIPSKCVSLLPDAGETCGFGNHIRFDLGALAEDFLAVDRLIYEDANGRYEGDAQYRIEGESLIIPAFDGEREAYRVYYHPRIKRISQYAADDTVIDIPSHIAEYIPYFVKGELYSYTDEPAEAAEAHNIYENGVVSSIRSSAKSARMESRYSQTY